MLAADQRDARYAFAQRVMASSLLTPCAPWPVGFLGGAQSKREVSALKLPLSFDMNVKRKCFSASVAHVFSAGKTKAWEGCLIVAQEHRNNEGHMRYLDDPSSCFRYRCEDARHVRAHFLRIPTNMCVQCLSSSCTFFVLTGFCLVSTV